MELQVPQKDSNHITTDIKKSPVWEAEYWISLMPGIFCMFGTRLIIQGFGSQSLMKFGHISVPDRQRIGSSGKTLALLGESNPTQTPVV